MFHGVLQTFNRHGTLAAAKYAGCRLLQRFMVLDITHFMIQDVRKLPAPQRKIDVDCRFLTADEVREFANDPNCDLPVSIADRIPGGYDFCFGGIVGGQLACYCWLALDSIEANNNQSTGNPLSGIAISFPGEFAFRYKGYTHPDFRGRGLYQLVAFEAAKAMQEHGVNNILSSAEWVNFSALKSSYRSGFEYQGHMGVAIVAGKRFVHYPDMSAKGILFDAAAEVLQRELLAPVIATKRNLNCPHQEGVLS